MNCSTADDKRIMQEHFGLVLNVGIYLILLILETTLTYRLQIGFVIFPLSLGTFQLYYTPRLVTRYQFHNV